MPELKLDGCRPTPLASYLKALGILRLISSDANNVSGQAADPKARGMWHNECFHLETELDFDALCHFFLEDYAPSPIMAPWNGAGGFYNGTGKRMEAIRPFFEHSVAQRFLPISQAVRLGVSAIKKQGLTDTPKAEDKAALIASLRAELPDSALGWMDAVLVLSEGSVNFPPLLGTGGNDGRLNFTYNFMCHLISDEHKGLFCAMSGKPRSGADSLLSNALRESPSKDFISEAIGFFAPGMAGGKNASTGYEGKSSINPWDFILMFEGAVSFAGAATRRHQNGLEFQPGSRASFPFTVSAAGSGWGGLGMDDEAGTNARGEFWAPLWRRPAKFCELEVLFSEGRAVLNGNTARNGLDFARSAKSLGVSRGFSHFQRFGFLKRAGDAYRAIPMARHAVAESVSESAKLISDFDRNSWLDRLRRLGRDTNTATSARNCVRQFEDALMSFLEQPNHREPAERVLVALGELCEWQARSPDGRETLPPPPVLSDRWIAKANDDSPEFRVAAALAGLGLPSIADAEIAENTPELEDNTSKAEGSSESSAPKIKRAMPMAAHFAPIQEKGFPRHRAWQPEGSSPTVVWGSGNLVSNMTAVLDRRIVEMSTRGLTEKPFSSATSARLSDVVQFLSDDFDDKRCAALLSGLIWARPFQYFKMKGAPYGASYAAIPFAYAALKPIFMPDEALRRAQVLEEAARLPIPPGLTAKLRAGRGTQDGRATDAAVRLALARCRASGLHSPFSDWQAGGRHFRKENSRIGLGISADRLAASLLIPINDWALNKLLEIAYPDPQSTDENTFEGGQNQ